MATAKYDVTIAFITKMAECLQISLQIRRLPTGNGR
jgi:hypothetical protein